MNCIKKAMACAVSAGIAMLAFATPEVSNVTMTQSISRRLVTITYSLSEDAVVTLEVMTNATPNAATGWASIGGVAVCNAQGAVWRNVTSADADGAGKYTITWRPDQSWTDESGKGFNIAAGCAKAVVTAWALDNTPDYMVVDISNGAQPNTQRYYPAVDFLPGSTPGQKGAITNNHAYKSTMLVMRKIMAKDVTWTMGSIPMEPNRFSSGNEDTHQVALTNNYYIGVFEVTQSQWSQVATNSTVSANFTAERFMRPMEGVCYNEIRLTKNSNTALATGNSTFVNYSWPKRPNPSSFLGLLRLKTGVDFDLPSEAQWEFAARAGMGSGFWNDGSDILGGTEDTNLARLGRYKANGGYVDGTAEPDQTCGAMNGTAIVGSYAPNAWGLYDMHGNVEEWCLDWYEKNISAYNGKVNIDPGTPHYYASGSTAMDLGSRVRRGGSWSTTPKYIRPACRTYAVPTDRANNAGLRVVCTAGLQ